MPDRPFIRSEWVVYKRSAKGNPSQYKNKITNEVVNERQFRHLRGQKIKGEKGYAEYAEKAKAERQRKKEEKAKQPKRPYYKERKPDAEFGLGDVWTFDYQTYTGKFSEKLYERNNRMIEKLVDSFPANWVLVFHVRGNVYGGFSNNPDEWFWRQAPVGAGGYVASNFRHDLRETGISVIDYVTLELNIKETDDSHGIAEIHVVAWKPKLFRGEKKSERQYLKPTKKHKNSGKKVGRK